MYSYDNMRAGQIFNWLDQTPVVLLEEVTMPEDEWGGAAPGWLVYIIETEEIIPVHEETLDMIESEGGK
ncbi:MAG: hypothetical protein CMK72_08035 [Pseudomonadaceae bacterium]|nr:hypothetical protein [Pseudomonadaceae bacterium]|tara:strand:+ start:184 stop:390 length:207 start_codon:yes stop_codon:yes gene_type:complete